MTIMAQTILVTPETLRSQATQMFSYADQHAEVIQRLTNLILTLDEVWTGEAQAAFIARFQNARDTFNSFEEALEAFAQLMNDVAEKLENTDRALKSRIDSIS